MLQLINPKCKICNSRPEVRESEHFYLKLSALQQKLEEWVHHATGWRNNALQQTLGLFRVGLQDRPITRDLEWGIPVPVAGYETKRIYVWFEAVCGYLSASVEWAERSANKESWKDFWENDTAIHYYIHGKDNVPFHTVIWPAILLGYGGLHLPDRIISSEYLTLEGRQFSKSRHWAVWVPDVLRSFSPDSVRFYLVTGGPETSDANFSWSDFYQKVNGELVATLGNLFNRVLLLVKNNFPNGLPLPTSWAPEQAVLINAAAEAFTPIGQLIESGKHREAFRRILELAQKGNAFLNSVAPWKTIKEDRQRTAGDLAAVGQVLRCLAVLIEPFLPFAAKQANEVLSQRLAEWSAPAPKVLVVDGEPQLLFRKLTQDEITEQQVKLNRGG